MKTYHRSYLDVGVGDCARSRGSDAHLYPVEVRERDVEDERDDGTPNPLCEARGRVG